MVEPLRLDKKELREQYRVSERLAVRVGALLSRKLALTGALLEMASPGSPAEALLLSTALLEKAAKLTKKDVAAVLKRVKGAGEVPSLTVHAEEGLRVLCLEEELEADKGFSRSSGGALALPQSKALLRPDESKSLFSPEEIARLKFVLLTSADPKAKIEALRSALVSPLPPEEKGVLCLMALSDATPEVRRETAKALKHLGLDPDLTDSIRGLADADPKARSAALGALKRIGPKASPAERGVILRLLFSVLENEKDPAAASLGVDVLAEMAPALAGSADALPDLVRLVIGLLASQFESLAPATRRLCRELGKAAIGPLSRVLWSQAEKADDRRIRAYLLLLLSDLPLPEADKARLAAEVAKTVADWSDSDPDCRRLVAALDDLGRHGVDALIAAWPAVKEEQQAFVLRIIDSQLARIEAPQDLGGRLAPFLLGIFLQARRSLRLAAMETRLAYHPCLSTDVKRKIAHELLRSAHDYRLDRVYDLTETVLHRMGLCSAEALLRAVDESPYQEVRLLALKVLSRQVGAASDPADAKEVERICAWAERLMVEFPAQGDAARAVGTLAQGPLAPAGFVERVAAELRLRLGKSANTLDYVQALAALAGGPAVPTRVRMDLAMLFLELLEQEVSGDLAEETQTKEGTLLEVKRPAQLYTDFLPAVVEGLERVATAPGISESLLERVTTRMIAKWGDVSEYKVIWGPNAVMRLAEALGAIGSAAGTPLYLKLAVLGALRPRISNLTIAQILGRILTGPEEAEPFLRVCDDAMEELCRMAVHQDFREREDRLAILSTLGRLARRAKLSTNAKRTETLRRRAVDLLFDGLRDRMPGAREALGLIAEAEAVPKAQRAQVSQRLARL